MSNCIYIEGKGTKISLGNKQTNKAPQNPSTIINQTNNQTNNFGNIEASGKLQSQLGLGGDGIKDWKVGFESPLNHLFKVIFPISRYSSVTSWFSLAEYRKMMDSQSYFVRYIKYLTDCQYVSGISNSSCKICVSLEQI